MHLGRNSDCSVFYFHVSPSLPVKITIHWRQIAFHVTNILEFLVYFPEWRVKFFPNIIYFADHRSLQLWLVPDFHYAKFVSNRLGKYMPRLWIFSLICGFNPYIFTFKGNICPTNHCYFHFNRQCVQILIRTRCWELSVHIKQKNNEHPDYIRRTVTKDI